MARLLHLKTADRNLGASVNHTSYTRSQERGGCNECDCGKLCWECQCGHATEEGSQVVWRSPESLSNDCTPNAARPRETFQGICKGTGKATAAYAF